MEETPERSLVEHQILYFFKPFFRRCYDVLTQNLELLSGAVKPHSGFLHGHSRVRIVQELEADGDAA